MTPQKVTDLRDFVALLEERDELRRIAVEVDPVEEIAAITDRVCKGVAGRRALLFEKVRGQRVPVLTNLFGSPRRAAWAVGLEEADQLRVRLAGELAHFESGSAAERLCRLLAEPAWQPRRMSDGPCREVVTGEPDLRLLPALKCWPGDGGRFLTQPLVFTSDPETGQGNCGMYRVQLFDRRSATLHWRAGSGGGRHHALWQERGEPMPVAIALGGDPAAIYAASAPLPDGADELALAGFLRRRPLATVSCLTSDLQVPAVAEFIIEGLVHAGETRLEGPFGNHTGAYDPPAPAPLLRVTALTYRRQPLYPATVAGPPPMENGHLAKLSERLLLALLQLDFPPIVDINMPLETIFHGVTLLSVRDGCSVPELIRQLWRYPPLDRARLLVVLDAESDLRDAGACFWRAVNRARPETHLLIDQGRLAIDATGRSGAGPVGVDRAMAERISRRWREYGLDL
jgi:4-hydroxy-3-polyprenylbenzoate decarboxylase